MPGNRDYAVSTTFTEPSHIDLPVRVHCRPESLEPAATHVAPHDALDCHPRFNRRDCMARRASRSVIGVSINHCGLVNARVTIWRSVVFAANSVGVVPGI